jgi:hypothetical protein
MSHYLVELYTPNSAWLALSAEQRQHFLGGIGLALNQLSSLGVEVSLWQKRTPTLTKEPRIHSLVFGAFLTRALVTLCWRASKPAAGTITLTM